MKNQHQKILIVDDSKSINQFLQVHLKELGFLLSGMAYNGKDAIENARKDRPDLILMDIQLPGGLNGFDTARKIRTFCDSPIIFFTGVEDEETYNELKSIDAAGFIKKPIHIRELEINMGIALEKYHLIYELNNREEKLSLLNQNLIDEVRNNKFYERQILRSKQLYFSSFNALKEIIFVVDTDLNIILENSAFKTFVQRLGINNAMLGNSVEILSKYCPGFHVSDYFKVLKTGKEIYESETKINDELFIEVCKSPVPDEEGNITRVITSVKEITVLKQAERKLNASEKKYRELIEFLPEMICETDINGYVNFANQFALKRLGYTEQDILNGFNIFQIFAPEEKERAIVNFKRRYESGEEGSGEYVIQTQKKEKFPAIIYINLIKEQRKVVGVRGVMIDITDRKKAEEKIRETLASTETILENLPFGILLIGKDKKIRTANNMALKLFGGKRDQLVGKMYDGYVHTEKKQSSKGTADKQSINENIETYIRRGDGKEIPVLKTSIALRIDGEDVQLESFIDISDLKEYEKKLKLARENADLANKSKSEFLANMSHEIRTPLNAILGFAEALQAKITDPTKKQLIETIRSSGEVLLSLINDILDLSKIEANQLEINPEAINIHNVLEEIGHIFRQKADQKDIELITEIDKKVPPVLLLDEVRLRQLLLNLIGNAIKFTEKGHVKILVDGKVNKDKIDLKIAIEDTGIGIHKDQQELIFESFKQQSGQNTRKYGGTGLGLAICKKLVEKMNGTIQVQSSYGKGAVFTIILPGVKISNTFKAGQKATTDNIKIKFKKSTVLIVDDVQNNIDTIINLMEDQNIDFLIAHDGREALELLEQLSPDLVILDIRMPVLDGIQTVRKIRKNPKIKTIPIIAYTASLLEFNNNLSRRYFDGTLPKPARKAEIISELKKFLNFDIDKKSVMIRKKEEKEIKLKDIPENELMLIISHINERYFKEWKDYYDNLLIFEIEDMANDLYQLAELHSVDGLKNYAGKLLTNIRLFEIDKIRELLEEFGEWADNMKDHVIKNNMGINGNIG